MRSKRGFVVCWISILIVILVIIIFGIISIKDESNKKIQRLLDASPDFKGREFRNKKGQVLYYRLLEPLQSNLKRKYPFVIFLSGTSERGSNNINQLKYGGPFFEKPDNRRLYRCFVMIPQCPASQNWVPRESYSQMVPLAPEPTVPLRLTMELLFRLKQDPLIDSKRIYLMGLSSGASGVWDLIARYPQMFAAAVPFAGCGDGTKVIRFKHLPIWIFHGALDLAVNPNCSKLMDKALIDAGAKPRYTVYKMTGHSCWVKAFKDPELMRWLFSQSRL